MEPRVVHVDMRNATTTLFDCSQGETSIVDFGQGKTSVFRLVDWADEAEKSYNVRFSHSFQTIVDGQHRICAILDALDEEPGCSEEWLANLPAFMGAGIGFEVLSVPYHFGSVGIADSLESCYVSAKRLLQSFFRSALRLFYRLGHLFLSPDSPDHPETEFLVEWQWFLLHGAHPPRVRIAAASALWPGRVCFSGMV